MNKYLLRGLLLCLAINIAHAKESIFIIDELASDLGVPWGMAVLDEEHVLFTQREGVLAQLEIDSGKISIISGLPAIKVGGQGGLFDIALPANYADGQWLYISYNKEVDGQGVTTLARAKIKDQQLIQWQDLLISQSRSKKSVHYGGRITFDNQGHVFLSIGERGVRANAQDLSNHAGKIIRLNLDGSVPKDNPFYGIDGVMPEIWSYGHRNPQGLFFNTTTQQLWSVEHGPRGGDEINLIAKAKNYGWPIVSHGKEYFLPKRVGEATERVDMENAIQVYIPSIATSSLIQYQGTAFENWQGSLLVGALKAQHLNQIILDKDNKVIAENKLLRSIEGRIRNVIESPTGYLYISTDDGRILRVKPKLWSTN